MAGKKTLLLEILGETKGLQTAVREANTSLGGLGGMASKMGNLLKTSLGVTGVAGALALGKELFNVGVESEAMGLRYRAVFGGNTEALDEWVEANKTAFGMATDDMQGYLANLANMLTPLGLTTEAAGEQATKILELANAWSVWSGGRKSSEEAADALIKGILGQTRGLIDLGMKITEEEVAARVAATSVQNLTGVEKVRAEAMARMQIIQERSTTALEVYDEAMQGGAGAQREMSAAINTLKDSAGELIVQLAPAVKLLADLVGLAADLLPTVEDLKSPYSAEDVATAIDYAEAQKMIAENIDYWEEQDRLGKAASGAAGSFRGWTEDLWNTAHALQETFGVTVQTAAQLENANGIYNNLNWPADRIYAVYDILLKLGWATREETDAASAAKPVSDELAETFERRAAAADRARRSEQELADAQRAAVDPVFALIDAERRAQQAALDYGEAVRTDDVVAQQEALEDATDAQLDYNQALGDLNAAESIDALEDLLTQAGYSEEAIQKIIDKILLYNATKMEDKTPTISTHGTSGWGQGGVQEFQHGGLVEKTGLAYVHEGEHVVPAFQAGSSEKGPLPTYGGELRPVHIHLDVDGREIARAIVTPVSEELERQRRSRS